MLKKRYSDTTIDTGTAYKLCKLSHSIAVGDISEIFFRDISQWLFNKKEIGYNISSDNYNAIPGYINRYTVASEIKLPGNLNRDIWTKVNACMSFLQSWKLVSKPKKFRNTPKVSKHLKRFKSLPKDSNHSQIKDSNHYQKMQITPKRFQTPQKSRPHCKQSRMHAACSVVYQHQNIVTVTSTDCFKFNNHALDHAGGGSNFG